jgi:hypothetical protein
LLKIVKNKREVVEDWDLYLNQTMDKILGEEFAPEVNLIRFEEECNLIFDSRRLI